MPKHKNMYDRITDFRKELALFDIKYRIDIIKAENGRLKEVINIFPLGLNKKDQTDYFFIRLELFNKRPSLLTLFNVIDNEPFFKLSRTIEQDYAMNVRTSAVWLMAHSLHKESLSKQKLTASKLSS